MQLFISTTTYEYGNQTNVHRQPSVSFHEPTSSVAVDRTYSVELDAEGKINVLHEKYGEGSYKDYTFKYAEIKK